MKVQLKSTDGTENLYPVTAANSVIFPDGNNLEAKFPELVGKSAYQSWLDAGHTGTEEEFVESLKGEKGDTGPQGIQGVKGDTGATGPKGDQGNSGYTGAAGELEVVNNLTDGGATAALSAEQGKVLNDDIKGFVGKTAVLNSGWIAGYGYNNTSRAFTTNTERCVLIINDIVPGSTVRLMCDTSLGKRYSIGEFQDEGVSINSTELTRLANTGFQSSAEFTLQLQDGTKSIHFVVDTGDANIASQIITSFSYEEIIGGYARKNEIKDIALSEIAPSELTWRNITFNASNQKWETNNRRATCLLPFDVQPNSRFEIEFDGSNYEISVNEFPFFPIIDGYLNGVGRISASGFISTVDYYLTNQTRRIAIILRKKADTAINVSEAQVAISAIRFYKNNAVLDMKSADFLYQRASISYPISGNVYGERISLSKSTYFKDTTYTLSLKSGYTYISAFDTYGDYLVAVYPASGNVCWGSIYNTSDHSKICDIQFPIGSFSNPHANVACFGVEFASGNTELPLFYITQWNGTGGVLVYNIVKESDSVFTANLVQSIMPSNMDETVFGTTSRGDFVVDKENNALLSIRYKYDSSASPYNGNVNPMYITKFALPTLSDGETIVLSTEDILDSYIVDPMPINQDKKIHNGKMYVAAGIGTTLNSQKIYVVDLFKKAVVSVVDLVEYGGEPEALCIKDNSIFLTYTGGSTINKIVF